MAKSTEREPRTEAEIRETGQQGLIMCAKVRELLIVKLQAVAATLAVLEAKAQAEADTGEDHGSPQAFIPFATSLIEARDAAAGFAEGLRLAVTERLAERGGMPSVGGKARRGDPTLN